ncbi:MAG: SDR family NAD(P)-dependent oxidoreductase [Polyangiales bacterium]
MREIAVVTGGAHGIGEATARAFARRGLDVAIFGRRQSDLDATAAELVEDHSVRMLPIACDVSNAAEVERASKRVLDELGVPLVVVNNAGIVERAAVEEMHEEMWDRVLGVNLKGPFLVTRAFLPAMKARKSGRIVQVSSISATLGTARASAYCASKWGLDGFTKALAEELRGTGLQTMAVLPGSTDTDMLRGSGYAPQMQPEDVAGTILYLGLDAPDAMNGSLVEVFGP